MHAVYMKHGFLFTEFRVCAQPGLHNVSTGDNISLKCQLSRIFDDRRVSLLVTYFSSGFCETFALERCQLIPFDDFILLVSRPITLAETCLIL